MIPRLAQGDIHDSEGMMSRLSVFPAVLLAAILMSSVAVQAQDGASKVPSDARKQTTLGKYASSLEAYLMWRAKPGQAVILDVRTPEEYVYVGHPEMAVNVPVMVGTGKYDAEAKSYGMAPNGKFVEQVSRKIGKDKTILVLCRSGQRAAAAVNLLAKAGYADVYNVVDSFEGDMVKDPESVYDGKRMRNGWKNLGLPWTYELKPELVWSN